MTENFNSWNCSRCGGAPILFDERGVCQKCHDASEFAKTVEAEMGKAIPAMIKSFNKAGIYGGGFPDYCPPGHDEAIETLKEQPRINESLATVSAALEPLDGDTRGRVLRAVAVLLGIKGGVGTP